MLDERQLEMRVGARVAVTRKVLAARRNAFGLFDVHDYLASGWSIACLDTQAKRADVSIDGLRNRVHTLDQIDPGFFTIGR